MTRILSIAFAFLSLLFITGCGEGPPPMADERPEVFGPEGHRVPPFGLTTQSGDTFTHDDLEGKVHVADFFFTTCPTICPKMSKNMRRLQKELQKHGLTQKKVMLLSFSVDPSHDTPAVLRDYAEEYGADTEQWKFLTGDRDQIYQVGREGYMVTARKDSGKVEKTRHLHSGHFILVDRKRRIRGYFSGTDSTSLDPLIGNIRWLIEKGKEEKEEEG